MKEEAAKMKKEIIRSGGREGMRDRTVGKWVRWRWQIESKREKEEETVRIVCRERGFVSSLKSEIQREIRWERERETEGEEKKKKEARWVQTISDDEDARYTCGQDIEEGAGDVPSWRCAFLPSRKAVLRNDFLNSGPTAFVYLIFFFFFITKYIRRSLGLIRYCRVFVHKCLLYSCTK